MPTQLQNELFAGHFLLEALIASRPVVAVWQARDLRTEAEVALKLYAPGIRLEAGIRTQLQAELERACMLRHPHLLTPRYFAVQEGVPYLAMPYLPGGSLGARLLAQEPLSEHEIALLLQQIGSALHYLHTQSPPLLHQSIKPENILIAPDGAYLLADYGLSRRTRNCLAKATAQPGTVAMAYAPPELFAAKPFYTSASDIFSLGVTLYELCSGEVPWLGNGGISLLQGAATPYLPGTYSPVLGNIIRACLEVAPEQRPSARELEEEGAYFLEHGNWKSYGRFGIVRAKAVVYKKRTWLKPLLLTALVLLLLLALFLYFPIRQLLPGRPGVAGQADSTATVSNVPQSKPSEQPPGTAGSTPPKEEKKLQAPAPEPAPAKPRAVKAAQPRSSIARHPKPASLEDYIQGLADEQVPLEVKDRWKTGLKKQFAHDAVIHYMANGAALGPFTADNFVDVLMSMPPTAVVSVDSSRQDETGKIARLYVTVYE